LFSEENRYRNEEYEITCLHTSTQPKLCHDLLSYRFEEQRDLVLLLGGVQTDHSVQVFSICEVEVGQRHHNGVSCNRNGDSLSDHQVVLSAFFVIILIGKSTNPKMQINVNTSKFSV
jgi:hypothetical protein